jgi:methionine-rich copper-binding protein CopC
MAAERAVGLRGSRSRRRIGLLALALLVVLGGWLAASGTASAHNTLRSSSPADRATLDTVPAAVVLTFDEPAVALGTEIVVTGPAGPVADGAARLVDTTVVQPIRAGAEAGAYTVQWRVTSADGHPITGVFRFTARAPGGGATALPATAVPGPEDPAPATGVAAPETSSGRPGVPTWIWPVTAAVLLLSALTSAALRRRTRSRIRS